MENALLAPVQCAYYSFLVKLHALFGGQKLCPFQSSGNIVLAASFNSL